MTGFGRAQVEDDLGRFTVELKSVNGRFHESRIGLPPGMAALEARLRGLLKGEVHRGKIDCRVRFAPAPGEAHRVRFNEPLIRDYLDRLRAIAGEAGLSGEVSLDRILTLPGAVEPVEDEADLERYWPPLRRAAEAALEGFRAEREREGAALAEQIAAETRNLRERRERILAARDRTLARYRERLAARIAELEEQTGGRLDAGRLEIEVAMFADRADVSEEMVRLGAHLDRLEALTRNEKGGSAGKALDFLVQEILREVNTTASKLRDVDLMDDILEMKGAVERIREQIQNVE